VRRQAFLARHAAPALARLALAAACGIALTVSLVAPADARPASVASSTDELLRALDTDEPAALSAAVAAIEAAPTSPELGDALFAAGRASEDRLHDPARARALYERIVRELPDAGIALAAQRRAAQLHAARDHAREAAELARLIGEADQLAPADVIARADALAGAAWPGAPDAGVWLADWLCRTRGFAEAQARYVHVLARWPDAPQAALALRNATACAIEARDWALAEALAARLPVDDEIARAVRDEIVERAAKGKLRDRLRTIAWLALPLAFAALLASLIEAILRGGRRLPGARPPIEVMFLAPIAAVLAAVALTTHETIAPAVVRISIAGVALAWLSGATLDLLRSRGRPVRLRALAHTAAIAVGVLAAGYLALMSDDLIDLLAETLEHGPG
jgi:hypothetical protein